MSSPAVNTAKAIGASDIYCLAPSALQLRNLDLEKPLTGKIPIPNSTDRTDKIINFA